MRMRRGRLLQAKSSMSARHTVQMGTRQKLAEDAAAAAAAVAKKLECLKKEQQLQRCDSGEARPTSAGPAIGASDWPVLIGWRPRSVPGHPLTLVPRCLHWL